MDLKLMRELAGAVTEADLAEDCGCHHDEVEEEAEFSAFLDDETLEALEYLDDDERLEAMDRLAENMLLSEATPDLVRHCVRAVGKKNSGDVQKAFAICTAQLQKTGYLKPDSMELTAAGRKREKHHASDPDAASKLADYEKMLKKSKKEGVQGYTLPFYAHLRWSSGGGARDGEQWFRATSVLKNGNFGGFMLDAGAAGRSSSKAKKGSLDAKWAKSSWDEVPADDVPPKIKAALGEGVDDSDLDGLDEGQTYKQAQADIITGLAKDGWKVKSDLKIPHATSPDGTHRLYFKAQAIYLHTDKNQYGAPQHDFGNARSLHLGDIRSGGYEAFGKQLGRWTGQDTKGAPIKKAAAPAAAAKPASAGGASAPASAAHQLSPDQYHQKHGVCPDGYHFDDSTKRCVKAKSEGLREMHRLAGIDRYPDRRLSEAAVPRTMTGMVSEIRKYATGELHPDWTTNEGYAPLGTNSPGGDEQSWSSLDDGKETFKCMECGKKFATVKAAEKAQQNGCPKCGGTDIDLSESAGDEEVDLWNPDKDVTNPGHPMMKPKPKAAAPADKGAALLKALKCPPGKEAKLVYGRPSCAPITKA